MELDRIAFDMVERKDIRFDFGTFEAFNFRTQAVIKRGLTAREIVDWNHKQQGEVEFRPAGDRPELRLIFTGSGSIITSHLLHLNRLLFELGGDSIENYLRIRYAANICGRSIESLSAEVIEDHNLHLFLGTGFIDMRRDAAYELFELYYPEEYRVWEKSLCDGLIFDTDHFLDSTIFFVEELEIGEQRALLIAPQ